MPFLNVSGGGEVTCDNTRKETNDGIFSVKFLYSALDSRSAVQFPKSIIWSPCELKWVFFAWEVSWGTVLTLDQLKKRGQPLANRCFLCRVEEESIDHILIHCTKARVLWELLFALFGVMWVLLYSVRDTLLGWHVTFMGKKCRKVWMTAPLCLFLAVWKERNRIAFEMRSFRFIGWKILLYVIFCYGLSRL